MITHCWTNCMVTLQCGVKKLGVVYVSLSHIRLIQMLNIFNIKNMYDNSQHMMTSYIFMYYIKYWKRYIIRYAQRP